MSFPIPKIQLNQRSSYALLTAILLILILLIGHFWFVCDDAYISFRYARNLAQGHGLRYNLAPAPAVEGYSNFLWVIILAGFESLKLQLPFWAPLLSSACALILVLSLYYLMTQRLHLARGAVLCALVWLCSFPPFALWSSGGLETMPFTLLFFLTFWTLAMASTARQAYSAGLLALALALVRSEGLAWALLISILAGAVLWIQKPQLAVRLVLRYLAILLPAYIVFLLWRHSYYGAWLPNTVHAKLAFGVESLDMGGRYLLVFALTFISYPIVLLCGAIGTLRRPNPQMMASLLLAFAVPSYALVVGGDFMSMGRFLICGLPFVTLAFAGFIERCLSTTQTGLAIFITSLLLILNLGSWFDFSPMPQNLVKRFEFRYNSAKFRSEIQQWRYMQANAQNWKRLGLILREHTQPSASLVAGAVGAVGYYSYLNMYDRFGLVTKEVAETQPTQHKRSPAHKKTVSPNFFLPKKPSYLYAALITCGRKFKRNNKLLKRWKYTRQYHAYVGDLLPEQQGKNAALVLRRLRESESQEGAWRSVEQRLSRFCFGKRPNRQRVSSYDLGLDRSSI